MDEITRMIRNVSLKMKERSWAFERKFETDEFGFLGGVLPSDECMKRMVINDPDQQLSTRNTNPSFGMSAVWEDSHYLEKAVSIVSLIGLIPNGQSLEEFVKTNERLIPSTVV